MSQNSLKLHEKAAETDPKVHFEAIYSSSEDAGFPAQELNTSNHSSTAIGWQTLKFCEYPQEIGLRLVAEDGSDEDGRPLKACKVVTQLQILSHESKISSRIEVYLGRGDNYHEATFVRLGFVALDGNERTDYRARELKTVFVDDRLAQYVRLIVHRPHRNPVNLFEQVGLIAVNVRGIEPEELRRREMAAANAENADLAEAAQAKEVEMRIEDYKMQQKHGDYGLQEFASHAALALKEGYLDERSKRMLHMLAQTKRDAVKLEDFDLAKSVKSVEGLVVKAGHTLVQLQELKSEAVKAEDFDYAKEVKLEIEELKGETDKQVNALGLPYPHAFWKYVNGIEGQPSARVGDEHYQTQSVPKLEPALAPAPAPAPAPVPALKNMPQPVVEAKDESPFSARHSTLPFVPAVPPHEQSPRDQELIENYAEEPAFHGEADYRNAHGASQEFICSPEPSPKPEPEPEPLRNSPVYGHSSPIVSHRSDVVTDDDRYGNHGDAYDITGALSGGHSEPSLQPAPQPTHHPLEGVTGYESLPEPERWEGEQEGEAERTGLLTVLGSYRAQCVFSKVFALREAVLVKVGLMLAAQPAELPPVRDCLPELCSLITLLAEDKIHQVLVRVVQLLEDILSMVQNTGLSRARVAPLLEPVLIALMGRLADGNHRLRELARLGVDSFVNSPAFGPLAVGIHAMRPLPPGDLRGHAWRPLLARLHLLRDLVNSFGLDSDMGLSVDTVMAFPKNSGCFSHSNGEVRDAARDLTVAVERHTGVVPLSAYLRALRPRQLEDYNEAFERSAAAAPPRGPYNRQTATPLNVSPRVGPGKPNVHHPRNAKGRVETSALRAQAKESYEDNDIAASSPGGKIQCMFCGTGSTSWDEDALDLHYWKDCPLLAPCPACAQVVEVAGLTDHLLDECEHRSNYVHCKTTGLAVRKDDYAAFQRGPYYQPVSGGTFLCPLCYTTVPDTDGDWNRHLTDECQMNKRVNK